MLKEEKRKKQNEYYKENRIEIRKRRQVAYDKNPQKGRDSCKRYYENNLDSERIRFKKYYRDNKKQIKARNRKRWWANREICLEQSRKWQKANPERMRYNNAQKRARKMNAEGSHTLEEWKLLKKQYGFTCPCCKKKESEIQLTEDHIIPLIKGGSDFIENIQPLCKSCNSRKRTKVIKYPQSKF